MSEKSPGNRLTPKGVLLTGLAVGAAALITTGTENSGERDTVTISVDAKALQTPNPIQHVRGLARGDKVGKIPMLIPDHQRDADSTYAPRKKGGTEDLVVIYSPKLDRLMLEASGLSRNYPHNTGLVLTSFPGGILESVVTFSEKTHEVEAVVPNEALPNGTSSLYRHLPFSPSRLGFDIEASVTHSPTGNSVELSVQDLPPPPMGQSS